MCIHIYKHKVYVCIKSYVAYITYKVIIIWGTWLAQLVEHETLNLCEFKPYVGCRD